LQVASNGKIYVADAEAMGGPGAVFEIDSAGN
jgi:hypothetical protein